LRRGSPRPRAVLAIRAGTTRSRYRTGRRTDLGPPGSPRPWSRSPLQAATRAGEHSPDCHLAATPRKRLPEPSPARLEPKTPPTAAKSRNRFTGTPTSDSRFPSPPCVGATRGLSVGRRVFRVHAPKGSSATTPVKREGAPATFRLRGLPWPFSPPSLLVVPRRRQSRVVGRVRPGCRCRPRCRRQ
jgi:hypothetical protein